MMKPLPLVAAGCLALFAQNASAQDTIPDDAGTSTPEAQSNTIAMADVLEPGRLRIAQATPEPIGPDVQPSRAETTRTTSLVEDDDDFTVILAPYVWIPSVSGDIGLGAQGVPLNLDAGDLLDVFEVGGLIRGEVRHKSGWGVSADYIFADLGTSFDILIGDADADVSADILELAVNRRIKSGADAIDIYAGVRRWDADVNVVIDTFFLSGDIAVGDEWTDPLVGVRYLHPLSPRWRVIAQGDIGGFGVDSEFSWNAAVGVSYATSDHMQFQIVYRTLSVDRESPGLGGGAPVDVDITISGPLIGLAFRF
ncbi:MAG: hypothetical protein AAGB23_10190 [Pseudomonadota bacterium]